MNEILRSRKEITQVLDNMYANNVKGYGQNVNAIKSFGLQVLRTPSGKHNIAIPYIERVNKK